ncbi:MAG: hypothetical protein ACLFM0_11400 [Spirochaetales bacterium]
MAKKGDGETKKTKKASSDKKDAPEKKSQSGRKAKSSAKSAGKSTSASPKGTSKTSGQSRAPELRPAPSTAEGLSDAQRKLIATIEDALPKLNEESLALIVRNCQVALYNDEMERSREAVMEAQAAVEQGRVPGEASKPAVDIEQVSDQSFVVIFGSERIFFTREELRQLTKMCWATNNAAEGARSMFRWMERERRDFLLDSGVDSPSDPGLQELWSVIRSRYKAR